MTREQKKQIELKLQEMPKSCQTNYKKAMTGRSIKAAIKAACLECVGWQRKEIKSCTSLACPLYPYRPYK